MAMEVGVIVASVVEELGDEESVTTGLSLAFFIISKSLVAAMDNLVDLASLKGTLVASKLKVRHRSNGDEVTVSTAAVNAANTAAATATAKVASVETGETDKEAVNVADEAGAETNPSFQAALLS